MKKPDDPGAKIALPEKPERTNSRAVHTSPAMHAQRSKLDQAFGSGIPANNKIQGSPHGIQHHQGKQNYLQAWRIDAELRELIQQTRIDMLSGLHLQGAARRHYFTKLAVEFEIKCRALCQNDGSGKRGSHEVAALLRELAKAKDSDKKILQVEHVIDAMKSRITLGK